MHTFSLPLLSAILPVFHLWSSPSSFWSLSTRASSSASPTLYIRAWSVMLSIPFSPSRAWPTSFWKILMDVGKANRSLLHLYLPKVVSTLDSWSRMQCQKPAVNSLVPALVLSRLGLAVGVFFSWWLTWINGCGSKHILRAPDFLVVMTTLLTHVVGLFTFTRTSGLFSRSSSA